MESKVSSENYLNFRKVWTGKNDSENLKQNLKLTATVENRQKNEIVNTNETFVLESKKSRITEKRILSEGEASSGFETVSSVDDNDYLEDLSLSSDFDELSLSSEFENEGLTVQVTNKLPYIEGGGQIGRNYHLRKKRNFFFPNIKEGYFGDQTKKYQNNFKTYDKRFEFKSTKFYQRYNTSSEDENFDDIKRHLYDTHEYTWNRNYQCERVSNRRMSRSKCSDRTRSRKSRSQDVREKTFRMRSSHSKERKTDGRPDPSEWSSTRSNSTNRKRKRSPFSKSSYTRWSVDNRPSPVRMNSKERYSESKRRRRKERTPFLVELERKLIEADRQKSTDKESKTEAAVPQLGERGSEMPKAPEIPEPVNQFPNPSYEAAQMANFYPIQYPPFPTKSVDNLPLVPGPTGLPVHVTITGEQIPHDMEGRRIPVGPNGYYLPLDPTGRLFPHIVSPGNQAVPVHLTEDGVLRLPNSEPVPVGPGHKFPVNIDGNIIVIGADSKPLHPCDNLPREPPLQLLQMMNADCRGSDEFHMFTPQQQNQQVNPHYNDSGSFFQPPCGNNFQPSQEINSLGTNNFQRRSNDVLKCVDVETNMIVGHSVENVEQHPVKIPEEKTFQGSVCHSDSDMVLDSEDSDSASTSKPVAISKKGTNEEIVPFSSDEVILKKIFGENSTPNSRILVTRKDLITIRVQKTINLLHERNYPSPMGGRFIISNVTNFPGKKSPNESPLLRNRVKLPFLNPDLNPPKHQTTVKEESQHAFKFLPKKKSEAKESRCAVIENCDKGTMAKFPVFTFDFAMQCDFTSTIIKNLKAKVVALEAELTWLKNGNGSLKEYKNNEFVNKKETDELRKTLKETQSMEKGWN